jgi:hypothetical protein
MKEEGKRLRKKKKVGRTRKIEERLVYYLQRESIRQKYCFSFIN